MGFGSITWMLFIPNRTVQEQRMKAGVYLPLSQPQNFLLVDCSQNQNCRLVSQKSPTCGLPGIHFKQHCRQSANQALSDMLSYIQTVIRIELTCRKPSQAVLVRNLPISNLVRQANPIGWKPAIQALRSFIIAACPAMQPSSDDATSSNSTLQ